MIILDGAMGTMLQEAGLKPGEHPELFGYNNPGIVRDIHRKYVDAGSRLIYANTFGANEKKLQGINVPQNILIKSAIDSAREAAGGKALVALDVGPIGELLEPLGTLSFEEAYNIFKNMMTAGAKAGADLIVIETFTDLCEARAALLAAKENTDLPVWVTMSFEASGRTFTGTTVESMGITLTGLGADALGFNCSVGPAEILPMARRLMEWTHLPIIVKPNAGLPDPSTGTYSLDAEGFREDMRPFMELGISAVGGCCGTSPSYIKGLSSIITDVTEKNDICLRAAGGNGSDKGSGDRQDTGNMRRVSKNGICSSVCLCEYGGVKVVGERLNPTGKKRFAQALLEGDMSHICKVAMEEEESGADILDVNVGVPGADEVKLMRQVVKTVQGVTSLPLQIDSSNPEAIEAGLRLFNGKGIVNSVSADDEKLDAILPIVRKYGAAVVGLTLDEGGLPKTSQERIEKAEYILKRALEYGIPREDVIIDCLTLTVSAQQDQAKETLKAVRYVSESLGLHCALGVSNISFGLPVRSLITENFLIQAMHCGLDFPIINPNVSRMMDAVAAFRVLSGEDVQCSAYVEKYAGMTDVVGVAPAGTSSEKKADNVASGSGLTGGVSSGGASNSGFDAKFPGVSDAAVKLGVSVEKGLKEEAADLTRELLKTIDTMDIINDILIPALDRVGELYEKQVLFLPQLINAANAAGAAFEILKESIANSSEITTVGKGKIVIATVKGDIHDIGKNIVKVILENYGYRMIDLGRDVPPEAVLEAVKKEDVKLVGLSALMTTTLPSMKSTIELLKREAPDCKVFVGGAVLTESYAMEIGADFYTKDARASAEVAKRVLG